MRNPHLRAIGVVLVLLIFQIVFADLSRAHSDTDLVEVLMNCRMSLGNTQIILEEAGG